MNLFQIYKRALGMLLKEGWPVAYLALANAAIGIVQLAEPVLFGAIVDALANQRSTFSYIGAWAGLGLFGIFASVIVAVVADRMAHRRRLAVMAEAFDKAITLPISYHAQAGTGATIRNILAGSDALSGTWLEGRPAAEPSRAGPTCGCASSGRPPVWWRGARRRRASSCRAAARSSSRIRRRPSSGCRWPGSRPS